MQFIISYHTFNIFKFQYIVTLTRWITISFHTHVIINQWGLIYHEAKIWWKRKTSSHWPLYIRWAIYEYPQWHWHTQEYLLQLATYILWITKIIGVKVGKYPQFSFAWKQSCTLGKYHWNTQICNLHTEFTIEATTICCWTALRQISGACNLRCVWHTLRNIL